MKITKSIFFLLLLITGQFALHATEVEGTLSYVVPYGELVDREVVIDVPSRGQGQVTLRGNGFEWTSTDFSSYEHLGKTVFWVNFDVEFHGKRTNIHFTGTYLKGLNKLYYTGDLYKKSNADENYRHFGVFHFSFNR